MRFFLLPLTLLLTIVSSAQEKELPEQEYLRLEQEARADMNGDTELAFELSDEIALSTNPRHKASAAGIKSYLYEIWGEPKLSDEQYRLALKYLAKAPDSKEKMRLHSVILNYGGLIQSGRDELSEAYKMYEEGRAISEELNDYKQLIKFLNNMSRLSVATKNYKSALTTLKTSDSLLMLNADSYSLEQFRRAKATVNNELGWCFDRYGIQKDDHALIDSAITHYRIAINYADDQKIIRISSRINIAILMAYKGEFEAAEKRYFDLIKVCEENEIPAFKSNIEFNLGVLYFRQEKYAEAKPFFEKVLLFYKDYEWKTNEYIYTHYYLAVVQEALGNYEKAEEYLDLFLVDFEPLAEASAEEVREFNFMLGRQNLKEEISELQSRISWHRTLRYIYVGGAICLIIIIFFLIRKNILDKRKAKLKLEVFMEKFKKEQEEKKHVYSNTIQSFTLTDEKEKEILIALEKLIGREHHLKSDFSLQSAAKRIKTNTTYLSHVVNKNYGKSFSEYFNELKVNYVIHQLMENKTYRKYSTQAMAESVGYKSAVSFTRSFKKRTGVTPVQFLKSIES